MRRIKKAQSILEYVIILTAVILGIVAVAATFQGKVQSMVTKAGEKIGNINLDK